MDWDMAIKRNSTALKRVLATLVAMAGLDEDPEFQPRDAGDDTNRGRAQNTAVPHPEVPPILSLSKGASKGPHPEVPGAAGPRRTLPRRLHLAVLRLLRPAEAAVRRLIVIVARDMVVTLAPQRPPRPKPKSVYVKNGAGTGIVLPRGFKKEPRPPRSYSFSVTDPARRILFSPRRSPMRGIPRITNFDNPRRPPLPRPPSPDDEIDATRLVQRLAALASVLDDPQPYAKRFARWRARSQARRIRRAWPLRPGNPPGLSLANRRRPKHEIHGVLWDIHGLAYEILDSPDTS